ncbi:hypothetical protein FF38_10654 [Lucilia cuprina]|uniref:Uncharacterized protein n=1 Tax=Lucilia cuprina TaxID=7375 RepID=A0A0L0CPI5_LUCCU|nr:hypothetical protein FF38_10654 [Lucilia cuprina]
MDDNKFQRSCQRFREAMDRENRKRRKIVEIQSITYMPNLNMQSITGNQKKSDVLARLVEDLGIGEDDPHLDIPEVLASITPISPGKRTCFLVETNSYSVEVYIRRSLDVWIIHKEEKFVFPKSRNDIGEIMDRYKPFSIGFASETINDHVLNFIELSSKLRL